MSGRSARPSAILRATHSVMGAQSPVVRTCDCILEGFLARHKFMGDAWPIELQTQLALMSPLYNLLDVPQDKIAWQEMVHGARVIGRLVRPGAHVVKLCSADQVSALKAVLRILCEPALTMPMFVVNGAPLVVTRRPHD